MYNYQSFSDHIMIILVWLQIWGGLQCIGPGQQLYVMQIEGRPKLVWTSKPLNLCLAYHRARCETDYVLRFGARVLCNHAPNIQNEKSLKVLPCTRKVFRILHVNWKSIKWTWAETFEMNAKVELVLHFIVDNETLLQSLRSLEGE